MPVKPRRVQYAEKTRRALVAGARKLFATKGYADTSIEDVVKKARVTRGALYHHFRDKQALFEAVYEDVLSDQVERVRTAVADVTGPWDRFVVGTSAYLDTCLQADVQQIALLDAPAVLGWEVWREIDARYGLGMIRTGLQNLVDAEIVRGYPVDLLASLLVGMLIEAAMGIARAKNPAAARAQAGELVERFLASIQVARDSP